MKTYTTWAISEMQPNKIVYRWLAHSHIHIESQSFIVYGLCNFTMRLVHVCVRSCEVIVCCTQLLCWWCAFCRIMNGNGYRKMRKAQFKKIVSTLETHTHCVSTESIACVALIYLRPSRSLCVRTFFNLLLLFRLFPSPFCCLCRPNSWKCTLFSVAERFIHL